MLKAEALLPLPRHACAAPYRDIARRADASAAAASAMMLFDILPPDARLRRCATRCLPPARAAAARTQRGTVRCSAAEMKRGSMREKRQVPRQRHAGNERR